MQTNLMLNCALGAILAMPLAAANDQAAIKEIRNLYAKIDKGEPVKTATFKFALEADPMEGTITKFTYNGGFSAIKLSYIGGDHGGSDEHFYDSRNGLFFVFVKDHAWHFGGPGGTAEKPATTDFLTEKRYYIQDGKCVHALKRSVKGPDPKKLPALIAKEGNKIFKPDERLARLLKRAKALPTISDGKAAAKFFDEES